jgi:hypothetical protein
MTANVLRDAERMPALHTIIDQAAELAAVLVDRAAAESRAGGRMFAGDIPGADNVYSLPVWGRGG